MLLILQYVSWFVSDNQVFWQNVRPLPENYQTAIKTLFSRYTEYLAAFEPKETYLKKKVETELGSKMIYLKMRCGGLDADWGKVLFLFIIIDAKTIFQTDLIYS